MARRNPKIAQYKNIVQGKLFEFVLRKLIQQAGYRDSDISQLTQNKNRRRLHGRGGTYDPDFVGEFAFTVPFSYPSLLVGEAKYYSKPLGIKQVREFLGAFIDISQYARINTKSRSLLKYSQIFLEKRYSYVPVIFSINGFVKNAQALMYAHGIYFVSYENLSLFNNIRLAIDQISKKINFKKVKTSDISQLTDVISIKNFGSSAKKRGLDQRVDALVSLITPVRSYLGILDNMWPIHFLYDGRRPVMHSLKVKSSGYVRRGNLVEVKKTNKKNSQAMGTFVLPKYFIEEYEKMAKKKNKSILTELILFIPREDRIFPCYIKLSKLEKGRA